MKSGTSSATLVSGCSSGIGRAVALRLASEGWPVYASARNRTSIEDLEGAGCSIVELDVNDPEMCAEVVERIEAEHGAVGALVNNAGFGQQGPLEETPLEAIRQQFETNVMAAIGLCQLVLPGMRRQGWGRIVNVSSMGGRVTFPGGAAYHGSKFALEAMSDVLRFEVGGFGVDVIVIEPGPTPSSFGAASVRSMDRLEHAADGAYDTFRSDLRQALESTFSSGPSEGAATPEEVAEAVWASVSDDSPEPRVVVGAMAEQLIALKESGTARDWDRVVAEMVPRPGADPDR